jgi:hypothetical protein
MTKKTIYHNSSIASTGILTHNNNNFIDIKNSYSNVVISAKVSGAAAVSCDIDIYGGHITFDDDGNIAHEHFNEAPISISLSGTSLAADSEQVNLPYPFLRVDVQALSGGTIDLLITSGGF